MGSLCELSEVSCGAEDWQGVALGLFMVSVTTLWDVHFGCLGEPRGTRRQTLNRQNVEVHRQYASLDRQNDEFDRQNDEFDRQNDDFDRRDGPF